MKLLVTGGAGFIGSNFVHYMLREHADVNIINVDLLTYAGNLDNLRPVEGDARHRFVRADVADREAMEPLFAEGIDAVVHFAAESHVDRSIADPGVFVRSMSSRGRLGGVADATAGLVTVFDAARFDPVVVETVGVGQSEVDIVDHSDTVVVVVTPGWGDGVQADKAGILEIGDVFVINKADRPEVAETRRWLTSMLEMSPSRAGWDPPVVETVATGESGIDELVDVLDRHRRHLATGAEGAERRRRRAEAYVEWAVAAGLQRQMQKPTIAGIIDEVMARRLDPWAAANRVIDGLG